MNPITPEKDKLGFVEVGSIGRPIAQSLLGFGFLSRVSRDAAHGVEILDRRWSGRFGCFSERALYGLVTLVFAKCENRIPVSFRSSDEHGLDGTAWTGVC